MFGVISLVLSLDGQRKNNKKYYLRSLKFLSCLKEKTKGCSTDQKIRSLRRFAAMIAQKNLQK